MGTRKVISLLLVVLICASELYGQMVSGTVVDENNQPIIGASVFIASTTVGVLTDEKGFFSLRFPIQRGELVVSFIGYKRVVKEITSTTQQLFFQLEPDVVIAEELIVHSDNREWRRNLERFTKAFIGTTQNAQFCKILNPEVLDFRTKSEDQVLRAVASEPLVIENRALGYRLLYQLNAFEEKQIERSAIMILRKGWSVFEHLAPKDSVESKTIAENRRRTYLGSPRHLFRSLALHKKVEGAFSEGFELHKVDAQEYQKGISRRYRIDSDTLVADGITPAEKVLRLPSCLEVVYTKSDYDLLFRKELLNATGRLKGSIWTNRGKHQISLIESYGGAIIVDTLGNIIRGGLQTMFHGYWSWTSAIADMLPLDFNPDTDFEMVGINQIGGLNPWRGQLDSMTYSLTQGYQKWANRDTAGALSEFTKAIQLFPKNSRGYYLRGLLLKDCRDYARANADFTKALMIEPSNAMLYFQRGIVRMALREFQAAEDDFNQTVGLDSTFSSAYVYRGICCEQMNLDSLALADFTHALQIAKTAEAHLRRALIYKKQKKYDRAETELTESIKIKASAEAYFERGSLRMATGERVAGYLDIVKARSLGSNAAEKFLAKYEQEAGNDTLRFFNTPEIVVEALPLDVEKSIVKMVEITRQQRLSLNIAQTNININPDAALRRTAEAINEIWARLEELARRTNNEKLLRKLQDLKSLLVKLGDNFTAADPNSSGQAFNAKQRFLADMSLFLMEIQSFMEELQEYLVALNTKPTEKK